MKNETALITGSTNGIGKKTAELFLREGCKVMICSRKEEHVNNTLAEFKEKCFTENGIDPDFRSEIIKRAKTNIRSQRKKWRGTKPDETVEKKYDRIFSILEGYCRNS